MSANAVYHSVFNCPACGSKHIGLLFSLLISESDGLKYEGKCSATGEKILWDGHYKFVKIYKDSKPYGD